MHKTTVFIINYALFTSHNTSTVLQCHFLNVIVGPEDALIQVLQWQKAFVPALPSQITMPSGLR